MPTNNILYSSSREISDRVTILIPTVGQIIANEDAYYGAISAIVSTPYEFMVQLDDAGIDFEEITRFELFLLLYRSISTEDSSLIFNGLDISALHPAEAVSGNGVVLVDDNGSVVIDKRIHAQLCAELRDVLNMEKNDKKSGNAEAKRFMIERMRAKQQRAAKRRRDSSLESLIIAMVNTEQYKYNYETTLGLTIYQFNASVKQIIKKINFDNTMIGCYAGTVNAKELSPDALNWLSSK